MSTVRCQTVVRLLFVVLLVLTAPSRAPAQAAAASKALKAAAKAELKKLRADFSAIVADFDTAVDEFETSAETGDPVLVLAVDSLLAAWNSAQEAMESSVFEHLASVVDAGRDALSDFQHAVGGGIGVGYPTGFNVGDGGALDVYDAGWHKELGKARSKLEARLVKLRKPLEKKAGLVLDVQTRVSAIEVSQSFNASDGLAASSVTSSNGFGIDLLLSVDPIDAADDAIVALAGACVAGATVSITVDGAGLPLHSGDVLASELGRWEALFLDTSEGSYEVLVQDGADVVVARDSLGVG